MDSLVAGLVLGFGSGLAPGPLLALVVSTTLREGFWQGARVAVAPLLTDLPIIVLCVAVLGRVPDPVLAGLTLAGGLLVCWFAVETVRELPRASLSRAPTALATGASALRRGAVTNLLGPGPWLFWITAGGTLLVQAWQSSAAAAAGFLVGFYCLLVGMKVVVAAGVGAGRHHLDDRTYRLLLGLSAGALAGLGTLLVLEGARGLWGG